MTAEVKALAFDEISDAINRYKTDNDIEPLQDVLTHLIYK